MRKIAKLPSTLRESIIRRAQTQYGNDPRENGFCPRCRSQIFKKENFCSICGAGLVSVVKIEGWQLNSDTLEKTPKKKVKVNKGTDVGGLLPYTL